MWTRGQLRSDVLVFSMFKNTFFIHFKSFPSNAICCIRDYPVFVTWKLYFFLCNIFSLEKLNCLDDINKNINCHILHILFFSLFKFLQATITYSKHPVSSNGHPLCKTVASFHFTTSCMVPPVTYSSTICVQL